MNSLILHNTDKKLVFKKWTKKSWSAFTTLKKEIIIGVLTVVFFKSLGVMNAEERKDTLLISDKKDLDEFVVTAETTPMLQNEVARVVTVIKQKDIQQAGIQSVADLLEYVLNVDVRQRGVFGMQSDISVRGGSFDQVMILLNGMNISDPQTGHHNLNLPVSLDAIDKIEILAGPGARHLGVNAFSGAVNIITGQQKDNFVKTMLSYGEYGYSNFGVSGNFGNSKLNSFISTNFTKSDGYIKNTDFDSKNIFYNGSYHFRLSTLTWQYGYAEKGFGSNSFYTAAYPNQYEYIANNFASANLTGGGKIKYDISAYFRTNDDRFELFRSDLVPPSDLPSWYKGHNYHKNNVQGLKAFEFFETSFGTFSAGLEYRREFIQSNVLGEITGDTVPVKKHPIGFYTKDFTRINYSAFGEYNLKFDKWIASAGIMANFNTNQGKPVLFFPGIDVSYLLTKKIRLKASINSAMRMPTFTDLYYNGPTNIGNPNLLPETSVTYEGGVKAFYSNFQGHITLFNRRGQNLIDWIKPADNLSAKWQTQNLTKLNSYGIESEICFNMQKILEDKYLLKKISLGGTYMNTDKIENVNFVSRYVLDFLKSKAYLRVEHETIHNLNLSWNLIWQDRNGTYTDGLGNEQEYNPFFMLNTKASYSLNNYTVFAEASNLIDTKYFDYSGVIQPGRWIRIGAVITISSKR